MKKLITFIASIIVILIAFDLLFGYATNFYIKKCGLHGDYKSIEYVMKQCKEDVLFIGSSVVLNSLMPSIIEDSIGVTCYNTGANAQTLHYFHTILNCILKRYTPKMVILGMKPNELSREGISRYNLLIPYYHTGSSEIDSILESKNDYEKYLLQSNLYRYNTIWFRILSYHFIRGHENTDKGFLAKEKPIFPPNLRYTKENNSVLNNKVLIFEDIIRICKQRGINLIVYFPPIYMRYKEKSETIKEVERICKDKNIHFYNDTQDSIFLAHQDWFYDSSHLNKFGAIEYSKLFAKRLHDSYFK